MLANVAHGFITKRFGVVYNPQRRTDRYIAGNRGTRRAATPLRLGLGEPLLHATHLVGGATWPSDYVTGVCSSFDSPQTGGPKPTTR